MSSFGKDCKIIWNVQDILNAGSQNINYAMVVLNQPILNDPDLVISLWKGAQVRITVDGGTNQWLKFLEENLCGDLPLPDLITGDFDSISEKSKQYMKERSVPFLEKQDQDYTDFSKALFELMKIVKEKNLKLNHVLGLGTNSGRVDHIMANIETLHKAPKFLNGIPVVLMSSNSLTILFEGGKTHIVKVPQQYVDKAHAVGLIPLRGPTNLTTSGLKWNLENQRLAFGELVSTSNTFSNRTVEIMNELDIIWTVQYSLVEI